VSKNSKNKNIFVILIKISLLIVVFWLLINQVEKIDWIDFTEISIERWGFLLLTALLLFANLGIEFLKWRLILKTLNIHAEPKTKLQSYLAGTVTGFITPNMLGNFIGRMYYFKREQRPLIVLLTLYSNASQFLGSIFFGLLAIFVVGFHTYDLRQHPVLLVSIFTLGALLLFFSYYFLEKIPLKILQKRRWLKRLREILSQHPIFRTKLLFLSFSRHFVFSLQYYFLLVAFGITPSLELLFWIWQVYFWSTLFPSLWFGKLLIRESMALWILGSFTDQPAIVLVSSVILWLFNQSLPAILGIPFIQPSKQKNR
jgi:uncharacterized membrane protein YbhN (UPF0104 family)